MSAATILAAALLATGVAGIWLSAFGLIAAATPLDRLHFVGLATIWSSALVALAVLLLHPADQIGIKAILLVAVNWCFGSLLSHVQASLAYRIETNDRMEAPETAGDER